MITIALSKGRLLKSFIQFLADQDLNEWHDTLSNIGRELVVDTEAIRFLLVKGDDVSVYVEEGVADLGITGSDILYEQDRQIYNLMDLPFGYCHFALAAKEKQDYYPVVATKYVNFTKRYFESIMQPVKIIYLHGSVELAATIGMADAIMDIVQTGTTLKENGLYEQVRLDDINARLIANRHAYFQKNEEIQAVMHALKEKV